MEITSTTGAIAAAQLGPWKRLHCEPSLKERFWSRVSKGDDCWIWTGYRQEHGYGVMGVGKKLLKAHRIAFFLENHYIDASGQMKILHRCDNPSCVNPAHLFLGTQDDNMKDCQAKGRIRNVPRFGEDNPMARLTLDTVEKMRECRARTLESYKTIGERFGVSTMTAYRAITGQSWVRGVRS